MVTNAQSPEFEAVAGWTWYDAALIATEVPAAGQGGQPEIAIGAVDLYRSARSGDIGGAYLEIARFPDLEGAADYYRGLQADVEEQRLPPFALADFARDKAHERNPEALWSTIGEPELTAYYAIRTLELPDPTDLPPVGLDLNALLEINDPQQTTPALNAIGIAAESFDPADNPPACISADSQTAYWIGVFQPDPDDRAHCLTSVLSLGPNPETGALEAQLAPCLSGDFDTTWRTAENLIEIAERGGLEPALDAAESLALVAGQPEFWQRDPQPDRDVILPSEPEIDR